MEERGRNSRSSTYSKSVVFPRIKPDRREQDERDRRPSHRSDTQSLNDQRESQNLHLGSPRYGHGSSNDFEKYVLQKLEFIEWVLEDERRARSLLEDHSRTVVFNVQRLSRDLAMLQQQMKSDVDNVNSQSLAMKNLEMHQVAGIGDVWNRLTLGDLNNIKLSGDLNKVTSQVSDLKRSQENLWRKINKVERVVDGLVTKIEKINMELEKNVEILKVQLETQNQNIEARMDNTQNKYERNITNVTMDDKVEEHCSKILGNVEQRLDTFLEIHKSWQESFEVRIGKLEENLAKVMEMKGRKDEDLKKIQEVSTHQTTAFHKSYQKLKEGYREAFRAVYESITMVQTVLETKLKLTESDLKASINSILKTISHS